MNVSNRNCVCVNLRQSETVFRCRSYVYISTQWDVTAKTLYFCLNWITITCILAWIDQWISTVLYLVIWVFFLLFLICKSNWILNDRFDEIVDISIFFLSYTCFFFLLNFHNTYWKRLKMTTNKFKLSITAFAIFIASKVLIKHKHIFLQNNDDFFTGILNLLFVHLD